jgi:hypothetical protein
MGSLGHGHIVSAAQQGQAGVVRGVPQDSVRILLFMLEVMENGMMT